MKKLIVGLILLVGIALADTTGQNFYATSIPTINTKLATVSLLGGIATISANKGLTINASVTKFTGAISIASTMTVGTGDLVVGVSSAGIVVSGSVSANAFYGDASNMIGITEDILIGIYDNVQTVTSDVILGKKVTKPLRITEWSMQSRPSTGNFTVEVFRNGVSMSGATCSVNYITPYTGSTAGWSISTLNAGDIISYNIIAQVTNTAKNVVFQLSGKRR